ncbi:unnamed protein product [Echinostoma caproni]|uniref:SAM domain-containing protein n=1 Tax=Echinostoma caproni TaxID=27848 RepID=A0A183ABA1_9TREM|nr:unnamed protein product [Echinostoma caproni]
MVSISPADEVNEISLMGRLFESLTKQINDNSGMDKLLPGYLRMNTDGIKIVKLDDMQPFEKYTLTQSTIDYLKKPTFDIWHWEPNEMLALLEHMYTELGLVEEFHINPITMKRWLLLRSRNAKMLTIGEALWIKLHHTVLCPQKLERRMVPCHETSHKILGLN